MTEKILNEIKTPFYAFYESKLINRCEYIKSRLPKNVKLCYAVKANPFIVGEMSALVPYLEVCSEGEAMIVKDTIGTHEKSIISGVNKNRDFTEMLIRDENVSCFTAESLLQFNMLKELCNKHQKQIKILLRLTSSNQFGMNEEDLLTALKSDRDFFEIEGIQYFSATQKTSIKKVKREIEYINSFLTRLKDELSFIPKRVEYGTGFPVSYFDTEEFDEDEYFSLFNQALSELNFEGEIVLEVGRSLVACCGEYATSIVDIKSNKGGDFVIVDGGMNHITYYGQSMAMKKPYHNMIPERENPNDKRFTVCGSLCTINDIIMKNISMNPKLGDIIIFKNAGAYCMTEGISLFLSRDLPAVVKIDKDEKLIKIREHIPTYTLNKKG